MNIRNLLTKCLIAADYPEELLDIKFEKIDGMLVIEIADGSYRLDIEVDLEEDGGIHDYEVGLNTLLSTVAYDRFFEEFNRCARITLG